MAYADQKMSGSRIAALVIVAVIHIALGYAFVTGLAYQYVKKVAEDLDTFDVEEPPPPPPDEPPPPPPDQPMEPPPVVAPPAIVQTPPIAAPQIVAVPTPPPVFVPTPTAPPAPPPAPPKQAVKASPRGNQGDWFPQDSYPPAARRAEAEGRVSVSVTVGPNGRVTSCRVTSSSGNQDLDDATCRLATRNGRFNPAKDSTGAAVEDTYAIRAVRWQLEGG